MATLILKATEKCNSNCIYCDVGYQRHAGGTMPPELLRHLFREINLYLLGNPEEEMSIIWHGGEPLLLGVDYFRKAHTLFLEQCGETSHRIKQTVQTNLTLMSEEFIEVFQAMGIYSIGSSFEPIPGVRGAGKGAGYKEYNRNFLRGAGILRKHGIGFGIIYVVTRLSLQRPLDIYYYLSNLFTGINLNQVLIYDNERKDIAVTPEEFADFLGALFPVWWKQRDNFVHLEPFSSLTSNLLDGKRDLGCGDSGECAYNHVMIGPEGGASQCGRSYDWGILSYGNIRERSLAEIMADEQREALLNRKKILPTGDCAGCCYWNICHGGCPLDSYSLHKDFMHKSEWCGSRKIFLKKYFEPITGTIADARNDDEK